jgi:hypothetical protein
VKAVERWRICALFACTSFVAELPYADVERVCHETSRPSAEYSLFHCQVGRERFLPSDWLYRFGRHWNLLISFEKSSRAEAVGMGISIAIPAHKIAEVLNRPDLVEQRKQQDELVAKFVSHTWRLKLRPRPDFLFL